MPVLRDKRMATSIGDDDEEFYQREAPAAFCEWFRGLHKSVSTDWFEWIQGLGLIDIQLSQNREQAK
jgi:hypothetical protein